MKGKKHIKTVVNGKRCTQKVFFFFGGHYFLGQLKDFTDRFSTLPIERSCNQSQKALWLLEAKVPRGRTNLCLGSFVRASGIGVSGGLTIDQQGPEDDVPGRHVVACLHVYLLILLGIMIGCLRRTNGFCRWMMDFVEIV